MGLHGVSFTGHAVVHGIKGVWQISTNASCRQEVCFAREKVMALGSHKSLHQPLGPSQGSRSLGWKVGAGEQKEIR